MKSTIGAVLALGIALAAPTAASAATFSVGNNGAPGAGPSITWFAANGKANTVRVSGTPSQVTITDLTDAITSADGSGCTTPTDSNTTLVCVPTAGVYAGVTINAGDGADSVVDSTTGFDSDVFFGGTGVVSLVGGEGADTITGGPSTNTIDLGPGADTANGGGGDDLLGSLDAFGGAGVDDGAVDRLSGDAGDDIFFATEAGDVLDGGTGEDSLLNLSPLAANGGGVTVRLDGATPTTGNGYPGQNLTVSGFETAYGGGGDDTLTGSAAGETLIGFGGADTIDGGGGVDFLYGNDATDYFSLVLNGLGPGGSPAFRRTADGANVIASRDGTVDRVDCGTGAGTTLNADDVDALSHCPAVGAGTTLTPVPAPAAQTVNVPVPVPVQDKAKAKISAFKAAKKAKGKGLRKNGRYSVAFTSNEATVGSVVLVAKAKSATIAKAGDLQLASKAIKTTAGKKQTVKLVVAKKLRKLLKKGRKFSVVVTLVDGGGNTTTKTQAVKVG